jgi:uncharacterized membrane protein
MDLLQDMLKALEDPAMLHSALVHLPIGLSIVGIPFVLLAALLSKSKAMRWTAFGLYAAFAIIAWFTMQSGEEAHALMLNDQPQAAHEIIERHEELAEKIWFFAAATAVLMALAAIPTPIVRRSGAWLGVVAALFTAGWVAVTGHHGGTAVYVYAVGTDHPMMVSDAPAGDGSTPRDDNGSAAFEGDGDRETASEAPRISLDGLDEREVHFVTHVLPILETTCQRCHNPNRMRRSGRLDLSTLDTATHGGRSGAALVPGNPDESLIMMRITSDDEEVRMPPTEPLTPAEIEAMRKWIADGAVWVQRDGA